MATKTPAPLVSVIISAYNHENFVQETIKSIIEQTYQNIELIIIDDGSTDLTWQKILDMQEECNKRFSNVIFETQENQGTCKTLNKLLSYVNGDYVYIIDSDDAALKNAIETEVNFLECNDDYALVVGNNYFIDKDSNIVYLDKEGNITYDKENAKYLNVIDFNCSNRDDALENFGSYESLYRGNYIPNGYLIRKNIFDIIGQFTPQAPLEDYWLMLQIAKYSKIKYIDETLYLYRLHGKNTRMNRKKMYIMTEKTLNWEYHFVNSLKKHPDFEIYKKIIMINKLNYIYDGWYKDAAYFEPTMTLYYTFFHARLHNPKYLFLWLYMRYKWCKSCKSKIRKYLIDHNLYKPKAK